jgi:hypothetical protein
MKTSDAALVPSPELDADPAVQRERVASKEALRTPEWQARLRAAARRVRAQRLQEEKE